MHLIQNHTTDETWPKQQLLACMQHSAV